MIKTLLTCLAALTFLSACNQEKFNINGEQIDKTTKIPLGWRFGFDSKQKEAYSMVLDSIDKQHGAHAIRIEKIGSQAEYGAIVYDIEKRFEGEKILLKGLIKTQNVSGFAGLWMRLDGNEGSVGFDNMMKENIHGTNNWKEFSIMLPYDSKKVKSIHIGGLLSGSGVAWFDNLSLFIDGKSIDQVREVLEVNNTTKANADTAFKESSGITSLTMSKQVMSNLNIIGQFWAFLKYHHPAIANGDYNWDAELFRILPKTIYAKTDQDLSNVLETYLNDLPIPSGCDSCKSSSNHKSLTAPNYGDLFNQKILSLSLINKLSDIKEAKRPKYHHYIEFVPRVGNPVFKNEEAYAKKPYPDLGYRLLCLYRYWAIINYFFPYRTQIGEEWSEVLKSSIPDFINASDQKSYTLCVLKLIARVNDTHANIWGGNQTLEEIKGKYTVPFEGKFITNNLVITDYIADTLSVKSKFKIGDIVLEINGIKINNLVEKYLPYTPASNRETKMRDLPSNYLLRSNLNTFKFKIKRGNQILESITSPGIDIKLLHEKMYNSKVEGYKIIDKNIGYIDAGGFENSQLQTIQNEFKNVRGLIIDMRKYPRDFIPFTVGNYIKSVSSPFVKFSTTSLAHPGRFDYKTTITNVGADSNDETFNQQVIVIVNSETQSRGEYTTMAFQSAPNVKVIGSTTAGADGNVSSFYLPGGISTMISGIGIFYPDNTETQRKGVKIDYKLKPTISGVKEGRDELLEKAKELIKNKN